MATKNLIFELNLQVLDSHKSYRRLSPTLNEGSKLHKCQAESRSYLPSPLFYVHYLSQILYAKVSEHLQRNV